MIKISPIFKYNIYLSEKKEGSIHTQTQAKNYLRTHGIKSSICYFRHQHQAHRFWCTKKANEHKIWSDAVLTTQKNNCLTMAVADCFPVVLTVKNKPLFSLVHAGWKPLLQNILELTILDMQLKKNLDPQQIAAWIGPGIRRCCYHFKDKPLQSDLPNWEKAISLNKGVWTIDLAKFIHQELLRLGVNQKQIIDYNRCTFCESEQFFSHQRTLRNNDEKGRMLVAVEPA